MKRLSVEGSFLWVQRFVAAEWRLLVPVAVAFLALPPLLLDLFSPRSMAAMMGTPDGTVMPDVAGMMRIFPFALIVALIGLVGGLSIVSLAMVPGISVREAIVHGLRRAPILVAAGLLIFVVMLLSAVLMAVLLGLAGLPFVTQQGLLMGFLFGVGFVVWIRLVLLMPILVERKIGPVAALRLAWEQSQGQFFRLFAAVFLYAIGAFVVIVALSSAIGAVLVLLGRMAGAPEIGSLLSLILFRVVAALGSAGLQLMTVAFYRQLGSRSGI